MKCITRRLGDEVVLVVIGGLVDKSGGPILEVMLVERDPAEQHAVRRIALGEVLLEPFQRCNLQWETVVLN